jgi:hypothetical protein
VIAFQFMRRRCPSSLSKTAFWRTLGFEFAACAEQFGKVRGVRDENGRWGVVGSPAGVAEFRRLCIKGVRRGHGVDCSDDDAVNIWLELVAQKLNG